MKNSILIIFILFIIIIISGGNLFSQTTINYNEDNIPDYELPELQLGLNGERFTSADEWITIRRPEILSLFEQYMYGRTPLKNIQIEFKIDQIDQNALDGNHTVHSDSNISLTDHWVKKQF